MRTQHAGQSALLFLDVVEVLQREKVDYAVIGAFALSVHGMGSAAWILKSFPGPLKFRCWA